MQQGNIKEIKRKIDADWQEALSQLSLYSTGKFYRIAGPVLIGLELIKLPRTDEYRPHFVCYALWHKGLKECLRGPIMLIEIKSMKGRQLAIPFVNHNQCFRDALESVKAKILFKSEISLFDLLRIIDSYSQTPPLNAAPNSYLQAALVEYKVNVILYKENQTLAEVELDKIRKRPWDAEHFAMVGKDVGKWIKRVESTINNHSRLLDQIMLNKQDKSILKLNNSDIL